MPLSTEVHKKKGGGERSELLISPKVCEHERTRWLTFVAVVGGSALVISGTISSSSNEMSKKLD